MVPNLFAPGPITPWNESANMTQANLLCGPFAPWNFRSWELKF